MAIQFLTDVNKEFMAATLSYIGDGVIVTSPEGNVIFMNHVAETLTGWKCVEAEGMPYKLILPIVDAETGKEIECPVEICVHSGNITGLKENTLMITRTGEKRYASATCSPILNMDSQIDGVVIAFRDITKIRTSEAKNISERDSFKAIFNSAPVSIMILNEAGEVTQVNETGLKLFNMQIDQMVGKKFGDALCCKVSYEHAQGCGHGMSCQDCTLRKEINGAWNACTTSEFELNKSYLQNNKERLLWFIVNVSQLILEEKKYAIVAMSDITDRKVSEQKLKKSQQKYKSLFMNMHSGFSYHKVLFDAKDKPVDLEFVEVNQAYEKMFGLNRDNIVKRLYSEIFSKDKELFTRTMKLYEDVIKSGHTLYLDEIYIQLSEKWYSLAAYCPVDGYVATILTDIDQKKKIGLELERAKEAAELANKTKGDFLANMSHEIRTPINGILGMIELTLRSSLNQEQAENLKTAKNCAGSLLKIINDILDFSKLEAGKLVIENVDFDIKSLLEDITKAHSVRANEKGVKLACSISSNIPQYMIGDPGRLRQILNNLINNAIKFTDSGEITVSVKKNKATHEYFDLKFAVSDTGIGISQKSMERLFRSFSQVDNSYTRKFSGSGLGLVICRQLVEMMSGKLWVESEMGKGSTFYFTIKLKVGNKPVINVMASPEIKKFKKALTILLVEDDNINQIVLNGMLKNGGHIIDMANNGFEGLEYYEKKRYDLILMDIQMPKMDGIEATKRIREREGTTKHTPIIALTAFALYGDRERFLANGMDDFIPKPVSIEELNAVIDKVISKPMMLVPDFSERIVLNDCGNLVFNPKIQFKSNAELQPVLKEIFGYIDKMTCEMTNLDLSLVEASAHKIKELFNQIDAEELKNKTFKIELAARRGNVKDIIEYIKQLKYEFETYKKTLNYEEDFKC